MGMTARQQELLDICVEEFIKSAAPVASLALEAKPENLFSSATIRNDLKTLEQMGYLHQVYTSGGRVPTTMGYKAYIDHSPSVTFIGDLVNDLWALTMVVERIDRKLFGTGLSTGRQTNAPPWSQNIHRMLSVPDLDISAFYLILKERLNGRKRE